MNYFFIKLFLYNFTFLNKRKIDDDAASIRIFFTIDLIWE